MTSKKQCEKKSIDGSRAKTHLELVGVYKFTRNQQKLRQRKSEAIFNTSPKPVERTSVQAKPLKQKRARAEYVPA